MKFPLNEYFKIFIIKIFLSLICICFFLFKLISHNKHIKFDFILFGELFVQLTKTFYLSTFCSQQTHTDTEVILANTSKHTTHQITSAEYLNHPSPKLSRTDSGHSRKETAKQGEEISGR